MSRWKNARCKTPFEPRGWFLTHPKEKNITNRHGLSPQPSPPPSGKKATYELKWGKTMFAQQAGDPSEWLLCISSCLFPFETTPKKGGRSQKRRTPIWVTCQFRGPPFRVGYLKRKLSRCAGTWLVQVTCTSHLFIYLLEGTPTGKPPPPSAQAPGKQEPGGGFGVGFRSMPGVLSLSAYPKPTPRPTRPLHVARPKW